jgi:hypothetical protein
MDNLDDDDAAPPVINPYIQTAHRIRTQDYRIQHLSKKALVLRLVRMFTTLRHDDRRERNRRKILLKYGYTEQDVQANNVPMYILSRANSRKQNTIRKPRLKYTFPHLRMFLSWSFH